MACGAACQVHGCQQELPLTTAYFLRYKICRLHSGASSLELGGRTVRWCQQCTTFHDLNQFDANRRSCQRALSAKSARRRRPPPPAEQHTQQHGYKRDRAGRPVACVGGGAAGTTQCPKAEARLFLQQKQALALAGAVCGPPRAEAAAQQQRQQEQRTRLRQPGPAAPASAQPRGCGAGWARGGPQALQGSVLPPVNVSAALAALGPAAPWLRREQSAAPQPPAGPAGQQAQQRLERRRRRQRQRGGEDDEWRLWLELSISQSSRGSGSALTSAGVPQREVQRTPTSSRLPLPLPAQQVLLPQQQAPTGAGLLGGALAVATLPAGLFFPQMQPGWQAGAAAGAHQACACGPGATAPAPPPAAAPALEQQARAQQPSTSRTFSQELSSLLGLLQQGEGGAAGAPAAPGPAPGVQPGWMPERCAAAPGTGQATGGQEPGRAGPPQQGMEAAAERLCYQQLPPPPDSLLLDLDLQDAMWDLLGTADSGEAEELGTAALHFLPPNW